MSYSSISDIEIFEGLSGDERRRLEEHSRVMPFAAGREIFDQASSSTEVYFILSGAVRILNYSTSGREVTFAAVTEGSYFGELAAIDGLPRTASATAIEDTRLAVLPGEAFIALIRNNSEVAYRVIRRLTGIIRDCDERIFDLSTLGAMRRVYSELLRMAQPDAVVEGQWVIRPYPPEREIASRVSTTRETVARAVSQLRRSGLVRRKDRNLFIMDREVLEKIVTTYETSAA